MDILALELGQFEVLIMASIALERVTKVYGNGYCAVDDVSLAIEDGEFMVLVGPSGCGKSTLLRMVAGLEEVTAGTVRIDERRRHRSGSAAPRHRDGVPELRALSAHDRPREPGLRPQGARAPKEEARSGVDEVAELLGLEAAARPQARAALRWPAAAGGHGARDRRASRGPS